MFLRKSKILILVGSLLGFFIFSFSLASAATLYLSPVSGIYTTGRNFTASVRVTTAQVMNAADGVINFSTDKFQVVGISKASSIFTLWVQEPSFSNAGATGNVRFEGVVLNPGFIGDGKILDITFQVKGEGTSNVNFASGSVLANDGQGTNILSSMGGATYTTQKAVTPSTQVGTDILPTKPVIKHFIKTSDGELVFFVSSDEELKWSNNSFARLSWVVPSNVNGVATLMNDLSNSNPGAKSEGLFDNKTFNFLEEGKHYFHIRFINSIGAGQILHYPLFIDLTPPESFKIKFINGDEIETYTTSNPAPSMKFSTVDNLSGIDRYEVKIDSGAWINAATLASDSGYGLPKQKPGEHKLLVRAYDKASNYSEASIRLIVEPTTKPEITHYTKHLTSPGEKFFVGGIASQAVTVEVILRNSDNEPIILTIKSDAQGNWEAIYDEIIPSGTYTLTAKQMLSNGAESMETDPVYVGVNSWFYKSFVWLKNIGGFVLLVLIVLAILSVAGYYYWHKFNMFRRRLRKEAKEAENALHRGVAKIRKEVQRGDPREDIARDLKAVEKVIEKEIKDIK